MFQNVINRAGDNNFQILKWPPKETYEGGKGIFFCGIRVNNLFIVNTKNSYMDDIF